MTINLSLRCTGCAAIVEASDAAFVSQFHCPNRDRAPDIDHVLAWDPVSAGVESWPLDASTNPFLRYRTLQHSYWLHRSLGRTDADHVELVQRLDDSLRKVGGSSFAVSPLVELPPAAASALGVAEVWAKVDTHNVASSHKARHLMGVLLHLEARRVAPRTPLTIASCGNAAVAAATLAKASRRPLQVFVPAWASEPVRRQLHDLGASVTDCPRLATDPPGDPCMHRLRAALTSGALPFSVQGPENGFTIDGGATLGHELADQFSMLGVPSRLFIQAGGGALASATMRGLRDAVSLGALERLPRLHIVQSAGCAPLVRAWRLVGERALRSLGVEGSGSDADIAQVLNEEGSRGAVVEALRFASSHRRRFMWQWDEPTSIATGILDDESYDWIAVVAAMFETGGWPVEASERHIEMAVELADPSTHDADETGAASLAGALALSEQRLLASDERVTVTLTGARRR